jgi:hypothetical protein
LCDDNTVESTGARAICQNSSSLGELGDTSNASVFLVELGFNDLVFGGSDRGKDVGFALVVSICANTLKQLSARPN